MKKTVFFALLVFSLLTTTHAQNCYWVFLADKAGTTFDPYSYFDAKAIERYRLNDADLYDISNYPLTDGYVQQVNSLATEEVGQSRWLNAAAVMATPEQAAQIRHLPFVRNVIQLNSNMHPTKSNGRSTANSSAVANSQLSTLNSQLLHNQLVRMGGNFFRDKGINGKGIRIAIFDGGFPQVNTHDAFKHVRDEHRIVKTWNFPNKKEDVYGWNSHGLMTFSCIAGREGDTDLGLATGAEYLLARTEIEAEPFKEEVWWQMAVEWADKNGAQVISSSLGYGKDRYYTKDMDGQSFVAKAANMAARKGILVCNSAGNEGGDRTWRTIITPADADSVLCVGGINPSLDDYERTSFSSYGPSADGRQKPNVTAFAYARTANTGKGNDDYTIVPGTSFSCPLVAGFAACALQCRPGIKAMDLLHEIEKSADLYPYCDYTYGYGVPQADHFTGDRKKAEATFKFVKTDTSLTLVPLKNYDKCRIFIKSCDNDGSIVNYCKLELADFTTDKAIEITNGNIITAQLDGYVESYNLREGNMLSVYTISPKGIADFEDMDDETHFRNSLTEDGNLKEPYFMLGTTIATGRDELESKLWSPSWHFGLRSIKHLTKTYGLGWAIGYSNTGFRFNKDTSFNRLDTLVGMDDDVKWLNKKISTHRLNLGQVNLELFQRVRLRPCGVFHKGWHWDLGVYGSWGFTAYKLKGQHEGDIASTRKQVIRGFDALLDYRWNYGVATRLTRDWLGLYARFRLNGLGKEVPTDKILLPRLELGLNLSIPTNIQ